MIDAMIEYAEALAFYRTIEAKFYMDAVRDVGEDDFYDSQNNLVWTPSYKDDSSYVSEVNENNTHKTGLTSNWGIVGDVHSEKSFEYDFKVCLCTN